MTLALKRGLLRVATTCCILSRTSAAAAAAAFVSSSSSPSSCKGSTGSSSTTSGGRTRGLNTMSMTTHRVSRTDSYGGAGVTFQPINGPAASTIIWLHGLGGWRVDVGGV